MGVNRKDWGKEGSGGAGEEDGKEEKGQKLEVIGKEIKDVQPGGSGITAISFWYRRYPENKMACENANKLPSY